jgi:hypothetical protein
MLNPPPAGPPIRASSVVRAIYFSAGAPGLCNGLDRAVDWLVISSDLSNPIQAMSWPGAGLRRTEDQRADADGRKRVCGSGVVNACHFRC